MTICLQVQFVGIGLGTITPFIFKPLIAMKATSLAAQS